MSDEQEKPVDQQPKTEPQGPRGGERLAAARREGLEEASLQVAGRQIVGFRCGGWPEY